MVRPLHATAGTLRFPLRSRQQLDDVMHERERQRDRLEAATAAADRSVEIAQSYVVPAFERGA